MVVGGACHGAPFAATARYLLAGYLKPAGPVERVFLMPGTLSRRFCGQGCCGSAGLTPGARFTVDSRRLDENHAKIRKVWDGLGGGEWPDEAQWRTLRAADELTTEKLAGLTASEHGTDTVTVMLPMPGIRFLRLSKN